MWIYQIPVYAPVADLSAGEEQPLTDLSPYDENGNPTDGMFIRVTNTDPSQLPRPGTPTTGPFVADDNHDASISDDGNVIAFVSTRDLVPAIGNPYPTEDNDEIFTFVRSQNLLGQVTKTLRGVISDPIYNKNPTISGDGTRVVFASTADNPIFGMTNGNNPPSSRNEEIFYGDLVNGSPTADTLKMQITTTTPTNPGEPVNVLDLGRRMSRNGQYIAFESYADLANENSGANYRSFALYLYNTADNTFRRIGPRSDADRAAQGGDLQHYPGFTDYDGSGSPLTLVLESRENIKPDGTIPTTESDGLNPDPVRPAQIYSYPLDTPPATAIFTRLAKFPDPLSLLASTQLLPSNSRKRMAFNFALSELGTGNFDFLSEVYYYLLPTTDSQSAISVNFSTGATGLPILPTTVSSVTGTPTPSPTATATATATATSTPTATATSTATPTATPTGSPTGTPTNTPTATPTATPETLPAVLGVSPGMNVILDYQAGIERPLIARRAVGSIQRAFQLPIELSGLTMTINGAACGLRSVSRHRIEFVVPQGLNSSPLGTVYPLVINNNGLIMKTNVTIVPARPDIYNIAMTISPGGRAKLFNVTNSRHTTEPFTVRTIRRKGNRLVPTVLRIYVTGVGNFSAASIRVRIRDVTITPSTNPVFVEPGVTTFDFALPATLNGAGDQPVVVTVIIGNVTLTSRLDDTTSRVFIL